MSSTTTVRDVSVHASLIVRVFRTGLGRAPEPAALRSFAAMLRNGGGVGVLADAVATSGEFRDLHGQEDHCDRAYVVALFRNAFERDPDPGALATFVRSPSRAQLLATVADSDEARRRIDPVRDLFPEGLPPTDPLAYRLWLERYDGIDEVDLLAIEHRLGTVSAPLHISLLTVAEPVRPDLLLETIRSLEAQIYTDWSLCVACPHKLPTAVRRALEATAARVPGIVLVDAPPDAGRGDLWQAALGGSRGPFVAFLDSGDRLASVALYEIALALDGAPHLDLLYTDEDSLDETGDRCLPLFKPAWSPDMLLAGDAVGQLAVMRRARVLAVGGVREDSGSHSRFDLLLRLTEGLQTSAIANIPSVLFHRGRKPGRPLPFPRSRNTSIHPDVAHAVARHLTDIGSEIVVSDVYIGGDVWPRVQFPRPATPPRVSVLIPTRDQPELLQACLTGLLERTVYPDLEVRIADNGSRSAEATHLLRRLARDSRVAVETVDRPFNWSALNNRLASRATGDVFVLMNDDVDVIGPDWLDEMVRQLARPAVGIVGARLLYSDESLQHGGIVLQPLGATHVLRSARDEEPGYMGQLVLIRDLSAVTGACLAVRREVWEAIGGADESFPRTCNDLDLCLRARAAGHRVVWTPHALLRHVDGASRGPDDTIARLGRSWRDLRCLHDRWAASMDADPYLNANLTATDHDLFLATPPRRGHSWAGAEPEAAARRRHA